MSFNIEYTLTNNMYDLDGKFKLEAILDMAETSATRHDKVSHEYELGDKHFWIVSETKISFKKYEYLDTLNVFTYHNAPKRFDTIRNYVFTNINGEEILTMASKWLVVSKETMSFASLSNFVTDKLVTEDTEIYPYKSFKTIKGFDKELKFAGKFKVLKEDLDRNGHLNNTRYFYHLENILNLNKDEYIKEVDICYIKEIKFLEEKDVYLYKEDKEIYLEIRDEKSVNSRVKITLF